MTLAQIEYDEDCVSGLCVLRFKYLAAPTRRMIVTTVGTGLPNHRLHQATIPVSSTLSFPHFCVEVLDHYYLKTLTEDFLNFLNLNSSVTLSSACLSYLYASCTMCMFSFHHDDPVPTLLHLHLSTYSATCCS